MQSKKTYPIFILVIATYLNIMAQESKSLSFQINWPIGNQIKESLVFHDNSAIYEPNHQISIFYTKVPFQKSNIQRYLLIPEKTEVIQVNSRLAASITNENYNVTFNNNELRGKYELAICVLPVRKTKNGSIERLISFRIEFEYSYQNVSASRNPNATFTSVLSDGDIYKISVNQTGIFKLDKAFFESKLGINLANLNPKKIKIYGTRGGRLPEANNIPRIDDLEQLHIKVVGEEDGRFDNGDFVLFYAEGADIWKYQNTSNSYTFDKNIYENNNYFFIKIDNSDGLRMANDKIIDSPASEISEYYDMVQRLEEDKINLLGNFSATEGTGKEWYGDGFNNSLKEKVYTSKFDFSGLDISKPIDVEILFAGRSKASSVVVLSIGGKSLNKTISSVAVTDIESIYAKKVILKENILITEQNPSVKLNYSGSSSDAEGWIDYLQIVFQKHLDLNGSQLSFRNQSLKSANIAGLRLSGFSNQEIWDVTNPLAPKVVKVVDNIVKFQPNGNIREFVAHNNLTGAYEPTALGKINNQNLHAMKDQDMILVYHPKFKNQALKLAEHRSKVSGLKILVAQTDAIYNEFSGGKVDPVAIRDMAKLLLDRNPAFKYVLLFGDGSYDYKGIVKDIAAESFVPVYETDESLDPIDGFPSDDFYGLLGDNEGVNLVGSLDAYVGRLPVRSEEEATSIVDKIIHYDTSPQTFGDWKLRSLYVADDEDFNTHVSDIDEVANNDERRHPLFNQSKVYSDAFTQVSTSGEKRYPEVNKQINENIFKGLHTMTYLGHGGPLGWAQERILTVPEIQTWTNFNNLLLMITATCSFGAYDDPSITSPAEFALHNPKGGAIALMTTTRAVYTNSNKQLTDAVHAEMLKKNNGVGSTFGYILTEGKNSKSGDFFRINSRKFSLLGDPSQPISMPKYQVVTTKVNGADASKLDTLHALQKVTIEGYISDDAGVKIHNFNGTIYPTVFDKKSTFQTLSNDDGSPKFNYTMYRNILFKGAASVTNGDWKFSFWIPKNINYSYGNGRISYYSNDGDVTDAGGIFTNFAIGGTAKQDVVDVEGPRMDAFMNDENFVSGGLTNANPILLLNLEDDLGINVTGSAIGQDITATLDGDSKNVFVLNDFYESQKDNYGKGKVRFPLSNLANGPHYILAKAWDISGNSTEKRIDFIVSAPGSEGLKHVYNYPNPFTTNTSFQFEHDLVNTDIEILVNIYTITGKLVKSIPTTKYSSGFRVNDISWNGKDDFDAGLARGIYLYKIQVHSKELNVTRKSNFEKLIKL